MVLGSNTNPRRNLEKAKAALRGVLPDIVFTESIVTEPIGMVSDSFLNCMAKATSTLSMERLVLSVKEIERALGDDGHDTNVVNIDIDILQYGDMKLHAEDWRRDYIKVLYVRLNPQSSKVKL